MRVSTIVLVFFVGAASLVAPSAVAVANGGPGVWVEAQSRARLWMVEGLPASVSTRFLCGVQSEPLALDLEIVSMPEEWAVSLGGVSSIGPLRIGAGLFGSFWVGFFPEIKADFAIADWLSIGATAIFLPDPFLSVTLGMSSVRRVLGLRENSPSPPTASAAETEPPTRVPEPTLPEVPAESTGSTAVRSGNSIALELKAVGTAVPLPGRVKTSVDALSEVSLSLGNTALGIGVDVGHVQGSGPTNPSFHAFVRHDATRDGPAEWGFFAQVTDLVELNLDSGATPRWNPALGVGGYYEVGSSGSGRWTLGLGVFTRSAGAPGSRFPQILQWQLDAQIDFYLRDGVKLWVRPGFYANYGWSPGRFEFRKWSGAPWPFLRFGLTVSKPLLRF